MVTGSSLHQIKRPIQNPRRNRLAERAVQTINKAMRARNSSLRVSFHVFLKRVLFTHRNTSSVRGKTRSENLLERKILFPAVINYPTEERVFCAGPHTAPFLVMYVVRNGKTTAWLIQEIPDSSGRTTLASTSQIAPLTQVQPQLRLI